MCSLPSKMMYIVHILASILLSAPLVSAQQSISFDSIPFETGSRTAYIFDIIQDRRGFFWLATYGGLVKYDGYSFITYANSSVDSNSIDDDSVYFVFEDSSGNFWVSFEKGGFARFDRQQGTLSSVSHLLNPPGNDSEKIPGINCLLEDSRNTIWLGTYRGGLRRFDKKMGVTDVYSFERESLENEYNNIIVSLYETSNNRFLVGTRRKGLWEFDRENKAFTSLQYTNKSEKDYDSRSIYSYWELMSVTAIFEDSKGGLWIGTGNGLFYSEHNDDTYTEFSWDPDDPQSFSGSQVNDITEDFNGDIWFATTLKGLARYDRESGLFEQFRHVSSSEGLQGKSISSLYLDRFGTLWIGVSGYGLQKYSPLKHNFPYYAHKPNDPGSLSNSKVYSILEDSNESVWIGTLEGGLNRLDRDTNTFTHYTQKSPNTNILRNGTILSLCEDEEGTLWIGTVFGIDKMDLTTGQITYVEDDPSHSGPFPAVPLGQTRPIYCDREGTIWAGVMNQGLYRYDREKDSFYHFVHDPDDPTSLSAKTVKSIYHSASGTMWIGTEGGGLNRFDPKTETFTSYNHRENDPYSLNDSWIYCIHEDIDGLLWLGTRNGINHFDPKSGKAKAYTVEDGLIDSVVYGILPENDHVLWMSTNKGLSRFNTHDKTFENFDHSYGLQNGEFNTGAYFKNNKGEMYFGGQKGFHIFHPDTIRRNEFAPPIIFKSFKVYNREVLSNYLADAPQHYTFPHDQNFFAFEFAALDYISPEENRYAYKLEGVDRKWVDSGTRRFVSYASLAPGNYEFRVKGANSHGVWNEEGASLKFTVLPHFTDTWWFKTLLALCAVSAVFIIFRARINGLKKREQELENKVALRTKELQQKTEQLEVKSEELEAFSYSVSHDLRTPLWQINLFSKLIKESPSSQLDEESVKHMDLIRRSCTRSLNIVNNLLKLSMVTQGRLTLEMVNLSMLVSSIVEEMKRIHPDRTIDFNIQDDVSAKCDEGLIRLLFENLLENAIKYTAGREHARIGFQSKSINGERQFRVSDNGIGLSPDNLDNIFYAFQRGPNQTEVEGHGIGLNICKRIVERHNGQIRVESTLDEGAVFIFTLP